jgi:hypothetical protein
MHKINIEFRAWKGRIQRETFRNKMQITVSSEKKKGSAYDASKTFHMLLLHIYRRQLE